MIKIGDKVAYSRNFCRSIGALTGDLPRDRGIVKNLKSLGELTIAVIEWRLGSPSDVNVKNLTKVRS